MLARGRGRAAQRPEPIWGYYTTLARVTPHSVKVDESTSDYRLKEFDGSKKPSWREDSGHMIFVS